VTSDTPAVSLAAVPETDPSTAEDRPARSGTGERSTPPAPALPPLLIDITALSQLLARSEASLYRDDSAGRIPAGRKLGGSKRWVYTEIVAWVEAGCPCRRVWEAQRSTGGRRGAGC
jgi:predicted DNA-binding transcriptional regulator AlpA